MVSLDKHHPKRMILLAYNIHQGGGKTLFCEFIRGLNEKKIDEVLCYIDHRMEIPNGDQISKRIIFVKVTSNPWSRLKVEMNVYRIAKKYDLLFCFGNLPPIFSSKILTFVYVQNRYIISKFINRRTWKSIVRSYLERFWFKRRSLPSYHFIVQTESMKKDLVKNLSFDPQVSIYPFWNHQVFSMRNDQYFDVIKNNVKSFDHMIFIYVSSADTHKNHQRLVSAWIELSQEHIFPQLFLTISHEDSPFLISWILENIRHYRLNISLTGFLEGKALEELYCKSHAVIFPSYFESLGLPLLEAKERNIPILAPELDYVRDILDPVETFDPYSPSSIKKAVKRFLNIEDKKQKIYLQNEMLDFILSQH